MQAQKAKLVDDWANKVRDRDVQLKDLRAELEECKSRIKFLEEDAAEAAHRYEDLEKEILHEKESMGMTIQILTDQKLKVSRAYDELQNRHSLESVSQEYSSRELKHLTIQNIRLRNKDIRDEYDREAWDAD